MDIVQCGWSDPVPPLWLIIRWRVELWSYRAASCSIPAPSLLQIQLPAGQLLVTRPPLSWQSGRAPTLLTLLVLFRQNLQKFQVRPRATDCGPLVAMGVLFIIFWRGREGIFSCLLFSISPWSLSSGNLRFCSEEISGMKAIHPWCVPLFTLIKSSSLLWRILQINECITTPATAQPRVDGRQKECKYCPAQGLNLHRSTSDSQEFWE